MKKEINGFLLITVMVLTLIGITPVGKALAQEVWERDLTDYQYPYLNPDEESWSYAKPLWTVDVGKGDPAQAGTAADKDRVWSITREGLKSLQVSSGKLIWLQKGTDLRGITLLGNTVYSTSASGMLTAYDGASGKIKWQKKVLNTEGAMPCSLEGDLYIYWGQGLKKIDPNSGAILWQVDKSQSNNGDKPQVLGDVVFQTYSEQGALTTGVLYAFDRGTGKELWSGWGRSAPLARIDNTIYVENIHWMTLDEKSAATIIAMDMHTGKELKTTVYPRPATKPYGGTASFPKGKAIQGGYIYIDVDGALNRYPLGIDPALVTDGDLTVSGIGSWIAGPVGDRLIFQGDFNLSSMPVDRMSSVSYQGVNNPVTCLKVFGRALFVGQSDGRILVDDFLNGENVFIAETGSRTYPFVKMLGSYLVIRADNRILVYQAPSASSLAGSASTAAAAQAKLGKAKFVIDGQSIDLGADPAWLNNQLLVPFRGLFQALGATVEYDQTAKKVQAKKGDKTIVLTVGQNFGLVNDTQVVINPAPQLVNGTLYVPARSVSQALDCKVSWDYGTKTVKITSGQ